MLILTYRIKLIINNYSKIYVRRWSEVFEFVFAISLPVLFILGTLGILKLSI
jgi:hypothetical protein